MSNKCPFCNSPHASGSYLPDTFFNLKTFTYLSCKECDLIYLNPFPSSEDYSVMYPPSYQNGINDKIIDPNKKLPGLRFPYKKHFELISKHSPGNKILDYGCGNANLVINARNAGFLCDAVEFNPAHIEILKKSIPAANFYLIDDFLTNTSSTYDVIRLSNVLEHLEDPGGILNILAKKLTTNGILLIEGPIETNFSFALLIRKIYFKLLKNKTATHPPTHIFFANARNQKALFEKYGLSNVYFEITECEWPFPENWKEAKGFSGVFRFIVARFSMALQKLNKNWGNTFIYVGRKKT